MKLQRYSTSMRISLLTILYVSFLLSIALAETEVTTKPFACPVNTIVIPIKVEVSHDEESLVNLINGKGTGVCTALKDETIRFRFDKKVVIRRVLIVTRSKFNKRPIEIEFRWVPKDFRLWRDVTGYFIINPDGSPHCFPLGYYARIPDNVEVEEFIFKIPQQIDIEQIKFSELPSEHISINCPTPKLCNTVARLYKKSLSDTSNENNASAFVEQLGRMMGKYDCRRSFDYEPVPAWWLCNSDAPDQWFHLLFRLNSEKSRALFGSKRFRDTLDGYIAEEYYDKSIDIEHEIKKEKSDIKKSR